MLGRIISPGEDVQGGPRRAMVSNYFWQNYLGSDPHAVGNTIHLGGKSYTGIGVMPASFAPPAEHAAVFVSLWVGSPGAAPDLGVHFIPPSSLFIPPLTLPPAQTHMAPL